MNLFSAYTRQELADEAIRRGISIFPVNASKDIMESVQLEAREFWTPLYHEQLDATIIYPGPAVQLSETPFTIRRRAPMIGEHNQEIFMDELGFTRQELVSLKGAGII